MGLRPAENRRPAQKTAAAPQGRKRLPLPEKPASPRKRAGTERFLFSVTIFHQRSHREKFCDIVRAERAFLHKIYKFWYKNKAMTSASYHLWFFGSSNFTVQKLFPFGKIRRLYIIPQSLMKHSQQHFLFQGIPLRTVP